MESYTYRVVDDETGIVLDADFSAPPIDWRDAAPIREGDLIHVIGVDRVVVSPIELGVEGGVLRVTTRERYARRRIESALHRLADTGEEEELDPHGFHGLPIADLAAIAEDVRRGAHASVGITWHEGGPLVLVPLPHDE